MNYFQVIHQQHFYHFKNGTVIWRNNKIKTPSIIWCNIWPKIVLNDQVYILLYIHMFKFIGYSTTFSFSRILVKWEKCTISENFIQTYMSNINIIFLKLLNSCSCRNVNFVVVSVGRLHTFMIVNYVWFLQNFKIHNMYEHIKNNCVLVWND